MIHGTPAMCSETLSKKENHGIKPTTGQFYFPCDQSRIWNSKHPWKFETVTTSSPSGMTPLPTHRAKQWRVTRDFTLHVTRRSFQGAPTRTAVQKWPRGGGWGVKGLFLLSCGARRQHENVCIRLVWTLSAAGTGPTPNLACSYARTPPPASIRESIHVRLSERWNRYTGQHTELASAVFLLGRLAAQRFVTDW